MQNHWLDSQVYEWNFFWDVNKEIVCFCLFVSWVLNTRQAFTHTHTHTHSNSLNKFLVRVQTLPGLLQLRMSSHWLWPALAPQEPLLCLAISKSSCPSGLFLPCKPILETWRNSHLWFFASLLAMVLKVKIFFLSSKLTLRLFWSFHS